MPCACEWPQRPEEGVGCQRAKVTGTCEPPCGWLGTELRSSVGAVSAVNCCLSVSPSPGFRTCECSGGLSLLTRLEAKPTASNTQGDGQS